MRPAVPAHTIELRPRRTLGGGARVSVERDAGGICDHVSGREDRLHPIVFRSPGASRWAILRRRSGGPRPSRLNSTILPAPPPRSVKPRRHQLLGPCYVVLLALICACATPPPPGGYQVFGKNYVPLKSAQGYSEVGFASWYGPGFHGKKTANSETYDMHARTAAHKLLPLGTVVEVTDLDSGRTVTARINDRGPFVAGRIIDLSKTLAADLNMLDRGTARVRVTAIAGPGGVPPPRQNLPGRYAWQVGAFTVWDNAEHLAGSLRARFGAAQVVPYDRGDALFHRVQVGPYPGLEQAQRALPRLVTAGLTPFLVRID